MQIEITIDGLGNSQIEVKGHVGPGCQSLTEAFEKAIGARSGDFKKPEFYKQAGMVQQQQQQAGS